MKGTNFRSLGFPLLYRITHPKICTFSLGVGSFNLFFFSIRSPEISCDESIVISKPFLILCLLLLLKGNKEKLLGKLFTLSKGYNFGCDSATRKLRHKVVKKKSVKKKTTQRKIHIIKPIGRERDRKYIDWGRGR